MSFLPFLFNKFGKRGLSLLYNVYRKSIGDVAHVMTNSHGGKIRRMYNIVKRNTIKSIG